jgi:hypothetical protein
MKKLVAGTHLINPRIHTRASTGGGCGVQPHRKILDWHRGSEYDSGVQEQPSGNTLNLKELVLRCLGVVRFLFGPPQLELLHLPSSRLKIVSLKESVIYPERLDKPSSEVADLHVYFSPTCRGNQYRVGKMGGW